jgi:hypothetical protein
MITNDELKDYAEGRFIEADKHVEICTELLALREQTRWREYSAKEMPPVGRGVLVIEQDGEVSIDYIDKNGKWGYNNYNVPNYWMPLPSLPEGGKE